MDRGRRAAGLRLAAPVAAIIITQVADDERTTGVHPLLIDYTLLVTPLVQRKLSRVHSEFIGSTLISRTHYQYAFLNVVLDMRKKIV